MSLITRMRKQDAVLWVATGKNKFGQFVYDDPVEIKCRWEGKAVSFRDTEGQEVVSQAVVYVDRVVSPDGDILWKGLLAGLPSADVDPNNKDAFRTADKEPPYRIRQFATLPNLRATEELLTAYL